MSFCFDRILLIFHMIGGVINLLVVSFASFYTWLSQCFAFGVFVISQRANTIARGTV